VGESNGVVTRVGGFERDATACDYWHSEYFLRWQQLSDVIPVVSGFDLCGCRCDSVS
jgi:hypothetical protein